MKKIVILFLPVTLGLLFSFPIQAQGQGSAFQQLQQAADDGNSAQNSYSNGSYNYEGARDTSGYSFDTPSTSPPAVDLRDAGDHPTPQLLRGPGE